MANKTFTVSITFDSVSAENKLEAAKKVSNWLKKDGGDFIYDVVDEDTQEEFTIDLSEDDDD